MENCIAETLRDRSGIEEKHRTIDAQLSPNRSRFRGQISTDLLGFSLSCKPSSWAQLVNTGERRLQQTSHLYLGKKNYIPCHTTVDAPSHTPGAQSTPSISEGVDSLETRPAGGETRNVQNTVKPRYTVILVHRSSTVYRSIARNS
jgi:hypothetical protein